MLGVAQLMVKEGGVASGRPLFDAGTPPLPGFAAAAALHFLKIAVLPVSCGDYPLRFRQ